MHEAAAIAVETSTVVVELARDTTAHVPKFFRVRVFLIVNEIMIMESVWVGIGGVTVCGFSQGAHNVELLTSRLVRLVYGEQSL